MKPLVFGHFASPSFIETMAAEIKGDIAHIENHEFPDGESYVRVHDDCDARHAVILTDLHRPNAKILPLIFLCDTLKDLGIASITLVAPYLPYMRQDIRFHPGEGITSRYFAKLLSQHIDHLITIDPHLHRYNSLDEIYEVPSTVLQANPYIAQWVKTHIEKPLVVGPDSESEQWAASAAQMIGCPYIILEKQRLGDRNVTISTPKVSQYQNLTPVLIDDIISTGKTMIKTAEALKKGGLQGPVCIGVHALFSDDAYQEMQASDIQEIITCNTAPHETNKIDITGLLVQAL